LRIADHAALRRVDLQEAAVQPHDRHADRGVLEGVPEALPALVVGLFHPRALGDVAAVDDDTAHGRVGQAIVGDGLYQAPGAAGVPPSIGDRDAGLPAL